MREAATAAPETDAGVATHGPAFQHALRAVPAAPRPRPTASGARPLPAGEATHPAARTLRRMAGSRSLRADFQAGGSAIAPIDPDGGRDGSGEERGRRRRALLIDTHAAIGDNARLHPPVDDPASPDTPTDPVTALYADADRLPPPDRIVTHNGVDWAVFGRTEVLHSFLAEHLAVRRHMAAGTPGGAKALALLERGAGPPVSIIPYEADGGLPRGASRAPGARPLPRRAHIRPINLRGGITAECRTQTFAGDVRKYVTYPVNQAMVTGRGGRISAATIAAHELRHASRDERPLDERLGDWTDRDEWATVTKSDNVLAVVHGEGLRDDHRSGARYESKDLLSTEARDQQDEALIAAAGPALATHTRLLDALNIGAASAPRADRVEQAFAERHAVIEGLSRSLAHPPRAEGTFLLDADSDDD